MKIDSIFKTPIFTGDVYISLPKEQTSALNREIAEIIGDISSSGISHQYRRTQKRIDENKKLLKQWKVEVEEITSQFRGCPRMHDSIYLVF